MKGIMFFRSVCIASLMLVATITTGQEMPADAVVEQEEKVVHINSANAETIAEVLNGIGISKAEAIITYREENGPFASLEELQEVKGIGEKTIAKNSERISLE